MLSIYEGAELGYVRGQGRPLNPLTNARNLAGYNQPAPQHPPRRAAEAPKESPKEPPKEPPKESPKESENVSQVKESDHRVDALFLAVSRLTNKVETMEASLSSMRESTKTAQSADALRQKIEDIEQKLRVNEQSFADFSSQSQREQKSRNDSIDRLLLRAETVATQAYHRAVTCHGKTQRKVQPKKASLSPEGRLLDMIDMPEIEEGTVLNLHYPMTRAANKKDDAIYMLNTAVQGNGDVIERWVPITAGGSTIIQIST